MYVHCPYLIHYIFNIYTFFQVHRAYLVHYIFNIYNIWVHRANLVHYIFNIYTFFQVHRAHVLPRLRLGCLLYPADNMQVEQSNQKMENI